MIRVNNPSLLFVIGGPSLIHYSFISSYHHDSFSVSLLWYAWIIRLFYLLLMVLHWFIKSFISLFHHDSFSVSLLWYAWIIRLFYLLLVVLHWFIKSFISSFHQDSFSVSLLWYAWIIHLFICYWWSFIDSLRVSFLCFIMTVFLFLSYDTRE